MAKDRQASRPNSVSVGQAAARDRQPVEDRRLLVSAQIFGGLSGIGMLLDLSSIWFMSRSRRILDIDRQFQDLDDENHWPHR